METRKIMNTRKKSYSLLDNNPPKPPKQYGKKEKKEKKPVKKSK
jgi:hypothetical protein